MYKYKMGLTCSTHGKQVGGTSVLNSVQRHEEVTAKMSYISTYS